MAKKTQPESMAQYGQIIDVVIGDTGVALDSMLTHRQYDSFVDLVSLGAKYGRAVRARWGGIWLLLVDGKAWRLPCRVGFEDRNGRSENPQYPLFKRIVRPLPAEVCAAFVSSGFRNPGDIVPFESDEAN